ncbi:hypothetical protein SB2_25595 [Methylobacterium radiotolerans]|nr:hypothetical protein SB3_28320 [Methylobacterium radiotolerans]KTS44110.1 hypothetical protein SB2_25595 [Methylobacterium radiotolerans]
MSHAEQIEALKGLLERVKAAEGASREISLLLHRTLVENGSPDYETWWTASDHVLWRNGERSDIAEWPHYTRSVDAALDLQAFVLPAWGGRVSFGPCSTARLWDLEGNEKTPGQDARTPALAICRALLSAKLALLTQEEGR